MQFLIGFSTQMAFWFRQPIPKLEHKCISIDVGATTNGVFLLFPNEFLFLFL